MMKPVENRHPWFVDKQKAPCTARRWRSERTEIDFLLEGFSLEQQEKERSHRDVGSEACDETSGEYSGTIDPLGGVKWTPQLWGRSCASSARTGG